MSTLAGKTAIVTGAAGGIGRAICLAFSNAGANVIAADVDEKGIEETVFLCAGDAAAARCDVSNDHDAQNVVASAMDRFGGLHILVNNAATFVGYGTVVEVSEEDWNRAMAVNLTGPFLMSKHAVPAMAKSGGGSIIHMASQLGQVGKSGHCWYGAAKAALIQLAKIMAIDHVEQNIRVNTISPGPISTARVHRKHGGEANAEQASGGLTVMGRLGRPEEIAQAAVFLASEASSYMTGADLLVDGGYNAW